MNWKNMRKLIVALVLVSVAGLSVTGYVFAQFMPPTLNTTAGSREIHEQYQWALKQAQSASLAATVASDGARFAQYLAALDQMESSRIAALEEVGSSKVLAVTSPSSSSGDAFEQYLAALEMMEQAIQAAVANE